MKTKNYTIMKKTILCILAMVPMLVLATDGVISPKTGNAVKANIKQVTTDSVVFYPIDLIGRMREITTWSADKIARITVDSIDIRNKNGQLYYYSSGKLEKPGTILFKETQTSDSTRQVSNAQLVYEQYYEYEKKRMGDPNYAIGKAIMSTGEVCLGVGIPCLITGTVLCICATNKKYSNSSLSGLESEANKRTRMNQTGCILAGTGGALTIVGIPLVIHGKKLMDLNV